MSTTVTLHELNSIFGMKNTHAEEVLSLTESTHRPKFVMKQAMKLFGFDNIMEDTEFDIMFGLYENYSGPTLIYDIIEERYLVETLGQYLVEISPPLFETKPSPGDLFTADGIDFYDPTISESTPVVQTKGLEDAVGAVEGYWRSQGLPQRVWLREGEQTPVELVPSDSGKYVKPETRAEKKESKMPPRTRQVSEMQRSYEPTGDNFYSAIIHDDGRKEVLRDEPLVTIADAEKYAQLEINDRRRNDSRRAKRFGHLRESRSMKPDFGRLRPLKEEAESIDDIREMAINQLADLFDKAAKVLRQDSSPDSLASIVDLVTGNSQKTLELFGAGGIEPVVDDLEDIDLGDLDDAGDTEPTPDADYEPTDEELDNPLEKPEDAPDDTNEDIADVGAATKATDFKDAQSVDDIFASLKAIGGDELNDSEVRAMAQKYFDAKSK